MFFIAGTKGVTSVAGSGMFYCPECGTKTRYQHKQVRRAATVFFVPVVNLDLLGEYIECQSCMNTFKMEVLNYDPEEAESQFEAVYNEAVKRVITMMMLADGTIEQDEVTTIRGIFTEIAGHDLPIEELENEIEDCNNNPTSMKEYLKTIGPMLNDSGKETIIKAAYYISVSDGELADDEIKLLKQISKHLEISPAHLNGIIAQLQE